MKVLRFDVPFYISERNIQKRHKKRGKMHDASNISNLQMPAYPSESMLSRIEMGSAAIQATILITC